MPNWCNNNITIEGPKDKIKKIWDSVQADEEKGFFNHLLPMPKELEEPLHLVHQQTNHNL